MDHSCLRRPREEGKARGKIESQRIEKLKALQKKAKASVAVPNSKEGKKAEAVAKKKAESEETATLIKQNKSIPKGHKKDTTMLMMKTYCPEVVESVWYD